MMTHTEPVFSRLASARFYRRYVKYRSKLRRNGEFVEHRKQCSLIVLLLLEVA